MTDTAINDAQANDNVTLADAVEAIAETVAAPTPANLFNDLQVALKLAAKFKSQMNGLHPSAMDIVKSLL